MKKTVFLALFLLFLPQATNSGTHYLELRASRHPGYLRIVIEGNKSITDKAMVYQRGERILVQYPSIEFSIRSETALVPYKKINRDTVMFFPGEFSGLKVFRLRRPARVVIDVYLKDTGYDQDYAGPGGRTGETDPTRVKKVVIDAGHGGYENGIVQGGSKEKNTVLDISKKLAALIDSGSSRSYLTRGSDRFMRLSERVSYANDRGADVFISIHIGNHSGIVLYAPVITEYVPEAVMAHLANRGQEGYREETLTLIGAMKEAAVSDFGGDMVSIRMIPYSIISKVEAPAVIIELPSYEDANYIEEFNAEIAKTLNKGLYIYEEIRAK